MIQPIDIEEKLLERVGKPFGMSARIMADRGGGRPEQCGVAFQDLIGHVPREPIQRLLGDSLSQKTAPLVPAISIVSRFLRPAVTCETWKTPLRSAVKPQEDGRVIVGCDFDLFAPSGGRQVAPEPPNVSVGPTGLMPAGVERGQIGT